MSVRHQFRLQFPPSEIERLKAAYHDPKEEAALNAGRAIAAGDLSRDQLMKIVIWKSHRSSGRVAANTDAEIGDALQLAQQAETDRAAVGVLTGLDGVDVRMASAILAAIDPDGFTILDVRALEALGVETEQYSLGLYVSYLAFCRQLANDCKVSLRELDQAMWQWSKERGKREVTKS